MALPSHILDRYFGIEMIRPRAVVAGVDVNFNTRFEYSRYNLIHGQLDIIHYGVYVNSVLADSVIFARGARAILNVSIYFLKSNVDL